MVNLETLTIDYIGYRLRTDIEYDFAPVRTDEVLLAGSARKLWLCCLDLLRKLGGSGSPGQLLQQQQTKIFNLVQSLTGGGAENQRKAEE